MRSYIFIIIIITRISSLIEIFLFILKKCFKFNRRNFAFNLCPRNILQFYQFTDFASRVMKIRFSIISIRGCNCAAFPRVACTADALRVSKKKKKRETEYSVLVEAVDSRAIKDIKFLLGTLLRCHVHSSTPQLSVWTE